jgi:Calcineurin-like phosphoesterase
MAYDLIGDIHGCCDSLAALLKRLGYREQDGRYRHPERQVIFLGDFIDRGPLQREVVTLVRNMVEAGSALAVMGNHEFNAIAWHTPDPETGNYLRPHTDKNRKQHQAFLDAFYSDPDGLAETVAWFKSLPLWLDLGELKVVHACWDKGRIERLREESGGSHCLNDRLLVEASRLGTWQFDTVEVLLKGKEIPLRAGSSFRDKDGNERHHIRVRWWDRGATTYRAAFMGPESARTHIPDDEVHGDHLVEYAHDAPPVFLGHYWMEGAPAPLAPNIACLDYSVAKPGGKLVAYRWDGEQALDANQFVWVERRES